jgi:two-component system NarL family response regulator
MALHVVVVEETALAGQVLAEALGREPGIEACVVAGSVEEVVERCASLAPCVLVVGDHIAERLDFQVLRGGAAGDSARVLVLGCSAARSDVLFWLRLGCDGYLSRQEDLQALKKAVLAVASGQVWARRVDLAALLAEVLDTRDKRPMLSLREREVLHLIAAGLSNVQISSSLSISMETVRWHVRRVLKKIGAKNRGQATELAQKLGFERRQNASQQAAPAVHPTPMAEKRSWAHRQRALGAAPRL